MHSQYHPIIKYDVLSSGQYIHDRWGEHRPEITSELCRFWNCEIWINYLSTNLSICSSVHLSTNHPSYLSTHPSINIDLPSVFYHLPYLSMFSHLSHLSISSTIYLRMPGKTDYIAWLTRWGIPIIYCLRARPPGHPVHVSVWIWRAVTRVSQHLKADGKYFRLEEWEYPFCPFYFHARTINWLSDVFSQVRADFLFMQPTDWDTQK